MPPETIGALREIGTAPLSVVEAFEQLCAQQPHSPAIVQGDMCFSYAELQDYAARIAQQLQHMSVQPEQAVGLHLAPSYHAMAATLGCWMAGANCVPISTQQHLAEQRQLLDDAEVTVVIAASTEQCYISAMHCLTLDRHSPQSLPAVTTTLPSIGSDCLAYIRQAICTFGRVTGIQIEHSALLDASAAAAKAYLLDSTDITLLRAPLTADLSIKEFLPSLISGGTLVVSPENNLSSVKDLSAAIEQCNITTLYLNTTHWRNWVDAMSAVSSELPSSLKRVTVTGNDISAIHYQRWLKVAGNKVLWVHAYGSAESTGKASAFIPPIGWQALSMPIGKPLRGTSVFAFDHNMQALPNGQIADPYTGDSCLDRSYLKRPNLDRQQFSRTKTSQGITQLFRTDQLTRHLPSGDVPLQGHTGRQIHITPHSFDPGEIENTLLTHHKVQQCLVVADRNGPQLSLLAYVVCSPKHIDLLKLARWLQQRLPAHKVPFRFVVLSELPRTADGQIDHLSLPAGSSAVMVSQVDYVAPQLESQK